MSEDFDLERFLSSNAQWASDVSEAEPDFFPTCAKGQSPKVLWIGCSDSRVPETVITGSRPGELFVHRNIANQFHLDDDSALSVLSYAVDYLGIEHVIIVGHTECGGAAACFNAAKAAIEPPTTAIGRFLAPLTHLAASLHLSTTPTHEALPLLVEENVKQQVRNVCSTPTITNAWQDPTKNVRVHGWVYEVGKGTLKDLSVTMDSTCS